jgi:hypothetical protein
MSRVVNMMKLDWACLLLHICSPDRNRTSKRGTLAISTWDKTTSHCRNRKKNAHTFHARGNELRLRFNNTLLNSSVRKGVTLLVVVLGQVIILFIHESRKSFQLSSKFRRRGIIESLVTNKTITAHNIFKYLLDFGKLNVGSKQLSPIFVNTLSNNKYVNMNRICSIIKAYTCHAVKIWRFLFSGQTQRKTHVTWSPSCTVSQEWQHVEPGWSSTIWLIYFGVINSCST